MTNTNDRHPQYPALLGWGETQSLESIADLITTQVQVFLKLDRVMVYRFDPDCNGQVIAESVDQTRLPSMKGLHFPAGDIPGPARKFLLNARQRVIVDVASKQKTLLAKPHRAAATFPQASDIRYSPVDQCHLQYLLGMGVLSSVTYSLVHQSKLWGLLVGHHSESRHFSEVELQTVQIWIDQFSVALAQERLRQQVQQHQKFEALSHQLRLRLEQEALETAQWEDVLQAIAIAFDAEGCRLSLLASQMNPQAAVYTYGVQPAQALESGEIWPHFYSALEPQSDVAAPPTMQRTILTSNEQKWRKLANSELFETLFQPANISNVLVLPLFHQEESIGYLSWYRQSRMSRIAWAGQASNDPRDAGPRASFVAWQEQRCQANLWQETDYALAHSVGRQVTSGLLQHWVKSHLARHSAHDAMTHLPNWMLFTRQLQLAIWQCLRQGQAIAVGILNLNQFRRINTAYGQTFGNYLMRSVAHRLSENLHQLLPAETEPPHLLARWHGDRFALLLSASDGTEALNRHAQAILDSLAQPFFLQNEEVYLTASLGIAIAPYDGDTTDAVIQHAETALDQAKRNGSGHYQFYSQSSSSAAHLSEQRLANDLYRALTQQELEIHYQPQADLQTGRVVGVEALVRWQHPQLGLISPDRFIPIAEENGLIGQLDEWVLRTACLQYHQWRQAGIAPMSLAVNVSATQFQCDRWVGLIKEILQDTDMAASELELEITEATLMQDIPKAVTILKQLKELGVQIAMDDFGTGYSSLNMLKHFPIDRLKIDKSFVRNSPQNAEDAAIVQTIVALGRGLNLKVVAEGVETPDQMAWLQTLNCDHFQGYYLARPQLANNLFTWLRTQVIATLPTPALSIRCPLLQQTNNAKSSVTSSACKILPPATAILPVSTPAAAKVAVSSMTMVLGFSESPHSSHQEHLIRSVTEKIRQSLHLNDILPTIVEEVRHLLNTDRVILYQFSESWEGRVVEESVSPHFSALIGQQIVDPCFAEKYVKYYRQGRVRAIEDIETADIADCHRALLRKYQVRANLVMPVAYQDQLWGLLIAHHCQAPRAWSQPEVSLLGQLAVQAAIAIHQGELYQQLELTNRELQKLSMQDPLTQVANRYCFDQRLREEWQRLQRAQAPLSLIICDIDYFKRYNDTYGHPAGDRCLSAVAKVLKDSIKRPGDLIARYGGEEFILVLPETGLSGARVIAQHIHHSLERQNLPHGGSPLKHVTMSIGIACQIPQADQIAADLIQKADQKLYEAKSSGRNCIRADLD